jgi:hypothetical protein
MRRVPLLSLAAMLCLGSLGQAATPSKPTNVVRTYPDWGGVWENAEEFRYTLPGGKPNPPVLTPEYAARYKLVTDAAAVGRPVSDPTANCIWPGVPRVLVTPYPVEYLIQEGRVTVVHEYQSQVRRIWTDGRGHPQDLEPSFNGHSIGHWEGDTLVVETVGLREDTKIDRSGLAHSGQLKVLERVRLTGPDTLEDQITMIDPLAYAQPWVSTLKLTRHRDWQILEYVCAENNRNPVSSSGKTLTLDAQGKPIDKEQ